MNYAFGFNKYKNDILDSKQKLRLHGKDLWTVLHLTSVFLPNNPNVNEINDFTNFVKGLLYFGAQVESSWNELTNNYIKENPFDFKDRESSMIWLCNLHNFVNVKLEKDLFECTAENLAKRWGNISDITEKNNLNTNKITI